MPKSSLPIFTGPQDKFSQPWREPPRFDRWLEEARLKPSRAQSWLLDTIVGPEILNANGVPLSKFKDGKVISIQMPQRYGKDWCASVVFAYLISRWPDISGLLLSANQQLSENLGSVIRDTLHITERHTDAEYGARGFFRLEGSQKAIAMRSASGSGAGSTGLGAAICLVSDLFPTIASTRGQDAVNVIEAFKSVAFTRLEGPLRTMIHVSSRQGPNDAFAHMRQIWLEAAADGHPLRELECITIPATVPTDEERERLEQEYNHPHANIRLWMPPWLEEMEPGTPTDPERCPEFVVNQRRRVLGRVGYSSLMQQLPQVDSKGTLAIDPDSIGLISPPELVRLPDPTEVVYACDLTFGGREAQDNQAIATILRWGQGKDSQFVIQDLELIDGGAIQVPRALIDAAAPMKARYPGAIHRVVLEDAGSARSLASMGLQFQVQMPVQMYRPRVGKALRAMQVAPLFESGQLRARPDCTNLDLLRQDCSRLDVHGKVRSAVVGGKRSTSPDTLDALITGILSCVEPQRQGVTRIEGLRGVAYSESERRLGANRIY